MRAKISILTVIFSFLIAICLDSFASFHQECTQLQQDVLRLHILANSDSDADQALKLKVRNGILTETGSLFNDATGLEDAKTKAAENLPRIEEVAREVLRAEGSASDVHVELERTFFDTRVYQGFTMPAGWYDALRVVIGEGDGHNWWCVLYPPLCVSAAEKLPEELAKFSPAEKALLESAPEYDVRFFVVELFEKFHNWLRAQKGAH